MPAAPPTIPSPAGSPPTAELLASVGQELRQAEARQRDWAPRRQRRPLRPPLAAGAQLELLRARLLPAVIAGLEEGGGERGGLRPAGAADGGREPLQLGTQHSVVGRAWAAASSQEEAGEGQAGSGPAQELHTGASGAAAERCVPGWRWSKGLEIVGGPCMACLIAHLDPEAQQQSWPCRDLCTSPRRPGPAGPLLLLSTRCCCC